jgi:hypothetical protein
MNMKSKLLECRIIPSLFGLGLAPAAVVALPPVVGLVSVLAVPPVVVVVVPMVAPVVVPLAAVVTVPLVAIVAVPPVAVGGGAVAPLV